MDFSKENTNGKMSVQEMAARLAVKEAKFFKECSLKELSKFIHETVYKNAKPEEIVELYNMHFVESPEPKGSLLKGVLEKAAKQLQQREK